MKRCIRWRARTSGARTGRFCNSCRRCCRSVCRPIIVTDAGFRTPWFQHVEALGWDWVGRIRHRHKMRWRSGGRWFDAKRCYQQASGTARYLGQAVLTRSNPWACQLVVYRGKVRGRKHYTCAGNVAQSRRSRTYAARAREPWLLATSLPLTSKLAKQVVRLYRLRMSIEEGFRDMKSHQFGLGPDLSSLRLGRTLGGVGVHRQSGLAGAVVTGDSHDCTGRPLSIPGQ